MIEIYQFDRATFEDEMNRVLGKRGLARAEKEIWGIHFGNKDSVEITQPYYKHVATVDTDDLDEAFRLTNLWDDDDRVEKKAPMHSTSVGDVLKTPDGTYHLVDNVGFTQPIWA